ncbi:MAG: hypothetical protein AAF197_10990, partial [Pseudomonadota bacterium]
WALRLAPLGRPFVGTMRSLGFKQLAAMVEMAPIGLQRSGRRVGAQLMRLLTMSVDKFYWTDMARNLC